VWSWIIDKQNTCRTTYPTIYRIAFDIYSFDKYTLDWGVQPSDQHTEAQSSAAVAFCSLPVRPFASVQHVYSTCAATQHIQAAGNTHLMRGNMHPATFGIFWLQNWHPSWWWSQKMHEAEECITRRARSVLPSACACKCYKRAVGTAEMLYSNGILYLGWTRCENGMLLANNGMMLEILAPSASTGNKRRKGMKRSVRTNLMILKCSSWELLLAARHQTYACLWVWTMARE